MNLKNRKNLILITTNQNQFKLLLTNLKNLMINPYQLKTWRSIKNKLNQKNQTYKILNRTSLTLCNLIKNFLNSKTALKTNQRETIYLIKWEIRSLQGKMSNYMIQKNKSKEIYLVHNRKRN